MLNKIILEKASLISYSQAEITNIASSSNHMRSIIKNQPDFNESFVAGSYKRGTMVKGISDVDIYYQYTGTGNPQSALDRLKSCLVKTYSNSAIRQDKPSILVDFNKIPFNITPYKKDIYSTSISIPNDNLLGWKPINLTPLETSVSALRGKNIQYGSLIKILKLWNKNHKKGIKNYEIEQKAVNAFNSNFSHNITITGMMQSFFKYNSLHNDSFKMVDLAGMSLRLNEAQLKTEWLKYIENK
jgi:hypothetical protein